MPLDLEAEELVAMVHQRLPLVAQVAEGQLNVAVYRVVVHRVAPLLRCSAPCYFRSSVVYYSPWLGVCSIDETVTTHRLSDVNRPPSIPTIQTLRDAVITFLFIKMARSLHVNSGEK